MIPRERRTPDTLDMSGYILIGFGFGALIGLLVGNLVLGAAIGLSFGSLITFCAEL